jgi:hypothetical protein
MPILVFYVESYLQEALTVSVHSQDAVSGERRIGCHLTEIDHQIAADGTHAVNGGTDRVPKNGADRRRFSFRKVQDVECVIEVQDTIIALGAVMEEAVTISTTTSRGIARQVVVAGPEPP